MTTINLEKEIITANEKTLAEEQVHLDAQAKLDAEVEKVLLATEDRYRDSLMNELGFDYKKAETMAIRKEREQLAKFPGNRIMSKDAIKATCIKYGLRFLPTRFYKGQLDSGIGPALEDFKKYNGGELVNIDAEELVEDGLMSALRNPAKGKPQFYIAAPATEFVLQPKPRDPLLFARLTIDKFFLIHKWGDDLTTKDLRTGFTDAHNWNSPYSDDGLTAEQRAARAEFGNGGLGLGGLGMLQNLAASMSATAHQSWMNQLQRDQSFFR
jgi:hypothetical protein